MRRLHDGCGAAYLTRGRAHSTIKALCIAYFCILLTLHPEVTADKAYDESLPEALLGFVQRLCWTLS